jgi:hypothetical protein
MLTKKPYKESRSLSSNGNFKHSYKLKNTRLHHAYGRTASAINLPRMKYNQELNNSNFYNSTNFSFKNNKNTDSAKLKSFNSLLNIHSIDDFLGKNKDPLEKQKELYENIKEEKLKIKNVLSNLISWDNEPTIKEIESFKLINLEEQNKNLNNLKELNKKINSSVENNEYENIRKLKLQQTIKENKAIGDAIKIIRHRVPPQVMKEINMSKGTEIKEKNFQLTQLKFSVFDKDYDPSKYKPVIRKEKDKKKEEEEKINKFKEKDYLIQFQKEQRRIEIVRKDEIAILYKNIIINKLKKKKFIEVLDQTYRLLDKARTEYSLSVDILKERIKSVQKYYNAFIVSDTSKNIESKKTLHIKNTSMNMNNSTMENEGDYSKRKQAKKTGLDIYEEKIKKYREYLIILEDINKEIKNYDDKFALIQSDLNSLLKISSDKIEELTISTRQLKYIYKELNNQQTQYYLNILKKGTDTRTEGLSWVVKRLMELNIPIDSSIFPGYLDQEQIDYIIQISKLGFESAQLKQILESLRDRQNGIKIKGKYFCGFEEKETQKYTDQFKGIQIFNLDINNIDELIKENSCNSFKSLNKLKSINSSNYNKADFKNKAFQNIIEDIQIKSIVENLKQQILNYAKGEGQLMKKDRGKNNIISLLLAQEKNKDYFKDVIILSERIQKLNEFIKKMRKEEFLIFEEKFKFGDLKDDRSKNFYDKVFNALFGSSSLEFSGFQKTNLVEN